MGAFINYVTLKGGGRGSVQCDIINEWPLWPSATMAAAMQLTARWNPLYYND